MSFMRKIKWAASGLIIAGSLMFASSVYGQEQGQLTGDHVRVRTYPCLESTTNILFQVNRGQAVEILGVSGDFYRVNVQGYSNVYIFREFISIVQPQEYRSELYYTLYLPYLPDVPLSAAPPAQTGVLIDDLIAYAKSYIGVPYRFGSTDPSRGFDCSGFVTVVMRNFGISLQRSSASMAATNGTYVPRNQLQPGDLVFFATGGGGRVSHVGIYIGGNQFIHSASCVGVKISSMDQTYYRNRYVRANRVL